MTTLIEVKPGMKFSVAALKQILPDVETIMFFAKLYELDARQLGNLLATLTGSTVAQALTAEGGMHSTELQDYICDIGYEYLINSGAIVLGEKQPKGEILPELWASLEIEVAKSIKQVAEKLVSVVGHMPGKQGQMAFKSMMVMNAKRPVLGDHKAYIHHAPEKQNLVILDVSGSMTEETVRIILDDVIALAYMANAHLAIVSNTTTHWMPGEYSVPAVLAAAEFGGTHYETLASLLDEQWGVVVTIADYDSSWDAKRAISARTGSIDQVLDISLVSQPTYLSEVVGLKATEVKPLLVAADDRCCMY